MPVKLSGQERVAAGANQNWTSTTSNMTIRHVDWLLCNNQFVLDIIHWLFTRIMRFKGNKSDRAVILKNGTEQPYRQSYSRRIRRSVRSVPRHGYIPVSLFSAICHEISAGRPGWKTEKASSRLLSWLQTQPTCNTRRAPLHMKRILMKYLICMLIPLSSLWESMLPQSTRRPPNSWVTTDRCLDNISLKYSDVASQLTDEVCWWEH